jgi:excisionase family DNA binding protein
MTEKKFENPPHTPTLDAAQVEPFVDINEVAKALSVSSATIRKWREKDLMPFPTYYVGRALRFKLTEVRAAIASTRHLNSAEAYELRCA